MIGAGRSRNALGSAEREIPRRGEPAPIPPLADGAPIAASGAFERRPFAARRPLAARPLQARLRHPDQRFGKRLAAAGDLAAVGHHHEERMRVLRVLIVHVAREIELRILLRARSPRSSATVCPSRTGDWPAASGLSTTPPR